MNRIINSLQMGRIFKNTRSVFIRPCFSWKLTSRSAFSFSKVKKEKPELRVPTINFSKYSEEHEGFLLYQNPEGARIKTISIAFLLCFLWGYWTYTRLQDDEIKINYMIMGALLAVPFAIFQVRAAKTLKKLVLDKTGDNVILTRFQMGGLKEQTTKAKVQVLRGIGKAFLFGGSVIKGGGVHGLEERNYWFQSKYILEPIVFQQVAQGNRIKIDRTKLY